MATPPDDTNLSFDADEYFLFDDADESGDADAVIYDFYSPSSLSRIDTNTPSTDQTFSTVSTVGARGGPAAEISASSKDDVQLTAGSEMSQAQATDTAESSSAHNDAVNLSEDIGGPQNLMGVKRFKKLQAVEQKALAVKKQLDALSEFQKTAVSEAINAGITSLGAGITSLGVNLQSVESRLSDLQSQFNTFTGNQNKTICNGLNSLPANQQTATTPPKIKPLMIMNLFSGMVLN